MRYCQECGSEIGENVTFCPYCGISQKPVQEKEENAQENTIAFNHWELADIVGNMNEPDAKDLSTGVPDTLPEAVGGFSEKREINRQSGRQDVTAENLVSKTDPGEISPQFILNTGDSVKLTPDKEIADNNQDSFLNPALEIFDEKAEIVLKSQIELQRMIFAQNQRIIELLERLLKKKVVMSQV